MVGGPERVRQELEDLLARTAADELMLTTMVYDKSDRIRSYELVAEAMPDHVAPLTASAAG